MLQCMLCSEMQFSCNIKNKKTKQNIIPPAQLFFFADKYQYQCLQQRFLHMICVKTEKQSFFSFLFFSSMGDNWFDAKQDNGPLLL